MALPKFAAPRACPSDTSIEAAVRNRIWTRFTHYSRYAVVRSKGGGRSDRSRAMTTLALPSHLVLWRRSLDDLSGWDFVSCATMRPHHRGFHQVRRIVERGVDNSLDRFQRAPLGGGSLERVNERSIGTPDWSGPFEPGAEGVAQRRRRQDPRV